MKYVIPVTVDHETAARLLGGEFPATASATRARLGSVVEKIVAEYGIVSAPPVVQPVETVEKKTTAGAGRKTSKKGSK